MCVWVDGGGGLVGGSCMGGVEECQCVCGGGGGGLVLGV